MISIRIDRIVWCCLQISVIIGVCQATPLFPIDDKEQPPLPSRSLIDQTLLPAVNHTVVGIAKTTTDARAFVSDRGLAVDSKNAACVEFYRNLYQNEQVDFRVYFGYDDQDVPGGLVFDGLEKSDFVAMITRRCGSDELFNKINEFAACGFVKEKESDGNNFVKILRVGLRQIKIWSAGADLEALSL